jgi:predicted nucleotidyltransferase component of viral defense system
MIDRKDFAQLVAEAMKNPDVAHMRPVIEKELLHFDLLYALDQGGLLDNLVFQGGTSLRLCYGGSRFSEDLDFAGGPDFTSHQLADIKQCLEDYLSSRYGLEVTVKEPNSLRREPEYADIKIDKWQIGITTSPEKRDIPKQKIKLEVANITAHTSHALPLQVHYDFLPPGYGDLLVMVETSNEIMADKLIALPSNTRYVRNRDIWDLAWLAQRGCTVDADLVRAKVDDYKHDMDTYLQHVDSLLERLPGIVAGKDFIGEMQRFLPVDAFDRTMANPKFQGYLQSALGNLFDTVQSELSSKPSSGPVFRM